MAIFPGRTGRRRRVLNEEVLSASSSHVALRAAGTQTSTEEPAPRYGESASVENHPQITDFIPRRFGTFAILAGLALVSTAGLEAVHAYCARVVAVLGSWAAAPLDLTSAGSLGGWLSAVLLLLSSFTCLLIYSIRRHKIADDRGRYRIWLAASAACLLLSVGSVAPWHRLLAAAVAHYTPWPALRENAIVWLVLGGLPLGWIAVRVLIDVSESKLASSAFVLAVSCYLTAVSGAFGWLPAVGPLSEPMATAGARLMGHWMLLLAIVGYARFVVLDAQGLITVRASRPRARRESAGRRVLGSRTDEETRGMNHEALRAGREVGAAESDEDDFSYGGSIKAFRRQQKSAKRSGSTAGGQTQWIDGTQPGSPDDDDDGPQPRQRKLSKSERKRLRKLKARDRAA